MSTVITSGMSVGSASMLSSRVTCSTTPPSLTPGDSSPPCSSIDTVAWIFSRRFTSRKSTCMVSPRTGCSWRSLRITGTDLLASDLHVEERRAVHQEAAQLLRADLEGDGIGVGRAVEHAGHQAGAAQAARFARAALGALLDREGWAFSFCHGGRPV